MEHNHRYQSVTVGGDSEVNSSNDSFFLVSGLNPTMVDPRDNLTGVTGAKTQLALYDVAIPALGVVIIATNLAVVLSSGLLLRKGVQLRATYLFLGNVAMADLVTGLSVLFGQFYPKSSRTQVTCAIQIGLIVSSTVVSIYSVGLIAVDRYIYIVHGLKYRIWIHSGRARFCIAVTWALGIVLGFLPLTGWAGPTNNGRFCWYIKLAPPGLILLTTTAGLIPIILVIVLYSTILYQALKKVMQLRRADELRDETTSRSISGRTSTTSRNSAMRIFRGGSTSTSSDADDTVSNPASEVEATASPKVMRPSKMKAVKVVLLTCGSFTFTWMPYFVASCMYVFCDEKTQNCQPLAVAIASPLAILGFLNSLLNPLIYAWWHAGFRTLLRKIICKGNPSNSETNASSSTNTKSSSSNSRSAQSASSKGVASSSGRPSGIDAPPIGPA